MTEVQRHAIAAGFLHVLETHHDVYEQWAQSPKEPVALGKLIQGVMGLASAPDAADLQAMTGYIDSRLKEQVGRIQAAHANAPAVGSISLGMEHEEGG